jgi:glycosyltransferase involved in cell wall biosynthesis
MLLEVNSPLAAERAEFGRLRFKGIARWCERTLWRGANAVLPVTQVLADQVAATRGSPGGVYVVPNGANLDVAPDTADLEALRRCIGLPPGAMVLGFVGFVRAWHGVGWALEALADLPDNVHLLVVGDGPALKELSERAAVKGMEARVHFTGRVQHGAVAAYTRLFDVALQTAAVPYASPLKLFEYMALGRAIIAPDQPNIREVLVHGKSALLFRKDDPKAFKAALAQLCQDGALRSRLGAAARQTVVETPFTWAHNAARIGDLARALSRT